MPRRMYELYLLAWSTEANKSNSKEGQQSNKLKNHGKRK